MYAELYQTFKSVFLLLSALISDSALYFD